MLSKKVRFLFLMATWAMWCVVMVVGVGGCQSDTKLTVEHSGRFLKKDEGANSRYASPMFGHQWAVGNFNKGDK